jgi:uncharacterized membrane protein YkvA (DUF1232 family)
MFEIIKLMMLCGTGIVIAFVVLLAMPKSELRSVLMPIVGWAFAIFAGVYCLSPVDVVPEIVAGPFGLIDDIGVAIAGFAAAKAAMKAKDE